MSFGCISSTLSHTPNCFNISLLRPTYLINLELSQDSLRLISRYLCFNLKMINIPRRVLSIIEHPTLYSYSNPSKTCIFLISSHPSFSFSSSLHYEKLRENLSRNRINWNYAMSFCIPIRFGGVYLSVQFNLTLLLSHFMLPYKCCVFILSNFWEKSISSLGHFSYALSCIIHICYMGYCLDSRKNQGVHKY